MVPGSVCVILSKAKNPSLFFNSILKWQFENTTILSFFHIFILSLLSPLQRLDQPSAVSSWEGQQIPQAQGQITQAEDGPGCPKDRRQQQIDAGTGGKRQGLPASAGELSPDDRAKGPQFQGAHGNIQQPEGCQVACFMKGRRQQEGQTQSPPPQQPKTSGQQQKARGYSDLQNASPTQDMRRRYT